MMSFDGLKAGTMRSMMLFLLMTCCLFTQIKAEDNELNLQDDGWSVQSDSVQTTKNKWSAWPEKVQSPETLIKSNWSDWLPFFSCYSFSVQVRYKISMYQSGGGKIEFQYKEIDGFGFSIFNYYTVKIRKNADRRTDKPIGPSTTGRIKIPKNHPPFHFKGREVGSIYQMDAPDYESISEVRTSYFQPYDTLITLKASQVHVGRWCRLEDYDSVEIEELGSQPGSAYSEDGCTEDKRTIMDCEPKNEISIHLPSIKPEEFNKDTIPPVVEFKSDSINIVVSVKEQKQSEEDIKALYNECQEDLALNTACLTTNMCMSCTFCGQAYFDRCLLNKRLYKEAGVNTKVTKQSLEEDYAKNMAIARSYRNVSSAASDEEVCFCWNEFKGVAHSVKDNVPAMPAYGSAPVMPAYGSAPVMPAFGDRAPDMPVFGRHPSMEDMDSTGIVEATVKVAEFIQSSPDISVTCGVIALFSIIAGLTYLIVGLNN